MYSSAVFTEGRPLCTHIYLERVVPHQPFFATKTKDTWLPDGEDRIFLPSLVLTQYRSVTDGRTDRRADGYAVAHTALAKLALWRAVKMDPRKKNIDAAF